MALRVAVCVHDKMKDSEAILEAAVITRGCALRSSACRAAFRSEVIEPKARLKAVRSTLRPSSAALAPLSAARDQLPDGRLVHGLTLTYTLDVKEAGKHTMRLPLLNGCAAVLPHMGQQL